MTKPNKPVKPELPAALAGFLRALPEGESEAPSAFVPAVQRLYGLLAGHEVDRHTYHEFLARKYGVT